MSLIHWFVVFRSVESEMNTDCAIVNTTTAQKYLSYGRVYSEYFRNRDPKQSVFVLNYSDLVFWSVRTSIMSLHVTHRT